jgi:hypothetical protein
MTEQDEQRCPVAWIGERATIRCEVRGEHRVYPQYGSMVHEGGDFAWTTTGRSAHSGMPLYTLLRADPDEVGLRRRDCPDGVPGHASHIWPAYPTVQVPAVERFYCPGRAPAAQVAAAAMERARTPYCTGVTASWCAIHGDCVCSGDAVGAAPACPLHNEQSSHPRVLVEGCEVPVPLRLLRRLVDEDDCRRDHGGPCQAHNFLLGPGDECPQQELKEIMRGAR